ncbi:MAG: AIR synthase family protein [Candidatus Bathyarchaeia archaeon]
MRRPVGKLSIDELKRYILPFRGAYDPNVILGQMVGGDAAIINLGEKKLILKADPITGAVKELGWLAVAIPSNDVATVGGKPQWLLPVLIMPTSEDAESARDIMSQIDKAAKRLGIAIVGGHTEFISGIDHPLVCSLVAAVTSGRLLSASGAEPGNMIVLTKGVAIEATGIIASDLSEEVEAAFGREFLATVAKFIEEVCIVPEALEAASIDGVTAMHDPTEGGILTALHELAEASRTGLVVYRNRIFISEEARKICQHFGIDPLGSLSSGALLITVKEESVGTLLKSMWRLGVKAEVIGEVKDEEFGRKMILEDGRVVDIPLPERDELWKIFEKITRHI